MASGELACTIISLSCMNLPTGPVWSFVQPPEPASRPVGRIIAQGQRNENRGAARNLGARCLKSGTGRAAARRRQGRAAVEKRSVGDRILNEWCAPFVSSEIEWVAPFDEFWGCERADCGLSFYPSCSAILRRRGPHSVRYRAG